MAEATENKEIDLNTFKEDIDSKTVEKEAINTENAENDANSSTMSIDLEIDEDIANIQAEAIQAAANSIKNNVDIVTDEIKLNNLEIEAALSSVERRGSQEATSSGVSDPNRTSRTECKLAAYYAEKTAEDGRLVVAMGEDLMETMCATIDVLKSHIDMFAEKAVEARARGTERGCSVADFYVSLVSRYEAAVAALERRIKKVKVALKRVQDCVDACMKYAVLAEKITDETLDESRHTKFLACFWNNKGRAAIIVSLKKERAALFMMRRLWLTVRADMEEEDLNRTAEVTAEVSDDETQQQCQHRERKTKIGHAVSTLLGLLLISITVLFKPGSDSFYAILILGLLTTGWCTGYWSVKLYKCLKEKDNEGTTPTARPEEDGFLENCERRLALVHSHLRKYKVFMNPDTESDTSSETSRVDDAPK